MKSFMTWVQAEFLDMNDTKNTISRRKKSDKLNFIQVKNFSSIKDIHCEENEKQPSDWGKLLASYTFDKELVSRIYIYFFFNFLNSCLRLTCTYRYIYLFIDMHTLLYLFIYFWLCWVAFICCCARADSLDAVRRLLIAVASLGEHRLQVLRLSSCGSQALEPRPCNCGTRVQLLCSMWDLPRPGIKPVSPALAGRFLSTVPPGKSIYL